MGRWHRRAGGCGPPRSRYLYAHPHLVAGKRVIELGAGPGCSGLVETSGTPALFSAAASTTLEARAERLPWVSSGGTRSRQRRRRCATSLRCLRECRARRSSAASRRAQLRCAHLNGKHLWCGGWRWGGWQLKKIVGRLPKIWGSMLKLWMMQRGLGFVCFAAPTRRQGFCPRPGAFVLY
jgi:hypothetical protein